MLLRSLVLSSEPVFMLVEGEKKTAQEVSAEGEKQTTQT